MSFFDGVTPQAVANAPDGFKEFQIGDNEAYVKQAYETTSESGNPMLVIVFGDSNGAEIKHFIVDGEYKMQKLKQFYQAFGIPMGNFNLEDWRGKTGIVVCKQGKPYNGKTYNQVSYLRPKNGESKPAHPPINSGTLPQGQGQTDNFTDDIPF